jgi:Tol biopolymer transport system component
MHGYPRSPVYQSGKPPLYIRCLLCGSLEDASWAPNGRQLVATSTGGWDNGWAEGHLALIDLSTGKIRSLTPRDREALGGDGLPAWSPNGKLIAFIRDETRGPAFGEESVPRLFVIAPSGRGGAKRLTKVKALHPSWSPDGRFIAFDDGRRIGILRRKGATVRYIATGTDPTWSPEGTTIAFEKSNDVWLVEPTGRRARLAVRDAQDPAWRPGTHHPGG